MPKILSYIVLFLTLPICQVIAQRNIKGSGYVLTEQRETVFFDKIETSCHIDVIIVQGELQPLTIEADDNLFPYIKTIVRNQVLKIYIPDTVNIVKYSVMNVLISMPTLTSLKATTGAKINASPQSWKTDSLNLRARTGGHIKINTKAVKIQLEASIMSSIELKGTAQQLNADLKNGAQLDARNFKAQKAMLTLATGARADLQVSDTISYNLSGNARLSIHGNPQILKSELNSGSKVIRDK